MARTIFRARSVLTASLLAAPAFCVFTGCSTPATAPAEVSQKNFGDGSATPLPDATTHKPPVDSGSDAHHADGANDGANDGTIADGEGEGASDAAKVMDDAGAGAPCTSTVDCSSGVCARGADAAALPPDAGVGCSIPGRCTCQVATCSDGVQNGDETDKDCGGSCPKCADTKKCKVGSTDCVSGECGVGTKGGACVPGDGGAASCTCQAPSCSDGIVNGTETDVDCGGGGTCAAGETCAACPTCATGLKCITGPDCQTSDCAANVCACPAGMTLVQTSARGPYCIDSYEVTYTQYTAFTQAGVKVSTQAVECAWNTSFLPASANLGTSTHPVTNVNWCDAVAYCTWADKHLCGGILNTATNEPGGSPITLGAISNQDAGTLTGNDSNVDEWYNACSGQGNYAYSYSSTFDPLRCNGVDSPAQSSTGPVEVPPGTMGNTVATGGGSCITDTHCAGDGISTVSANETVSCYLHTPTDAGADAKAPAPTCGSAFNESRCAAGGSASLFDMSGNVAEWENSCNATTGAGDVCAVRGGSFDSPNAAQSLTCAISAAQVAVTRNTQAGDIGFRCCL